MADQQTMDPKAEPTKAEPKAEPKGRPASRSYRVMMLDLGEESPPPIEWNDFGWWPGRTSEDAIKMARTNEPLLRAGLADGHAVVAIPEGHFEPLKVTIETIERESFEAVKLD